MDNQWKPLHHACCRGQVVAILTLLDRGADIDARDVSQCSPLHYACYYGHTDAVVALLDRGAPMDARDINQFTPLQYAFGSGHMGALRAILNRFIEIGSDMRNSDLHELLHRACDSGHVETILTLLDMGVDVQANVNHCTPLHRACDSGVKEAILALLNRGADIQANDINQETPLHHACSHGNVDAVMALLDNGAVIDARNDGQLTPLDVACEKGHAEVIAAILDRGTDILGTDKNQKTPKELLNDSENSFLVDRSLSEVGPIGNDGILRDPLFKITPDISPDEAVSSLSKELIAVSGHSQETRAFMESEERRRPIDEMEIVNKDIFTQCNDRNDEMCAYDERPSPNSRCKMAILQCLTQNAGYDNRERNKILEIMSRDENKHFDKDVIACEEFSMDDLQFTLTRANAVHMIGHNVGSEGLENESNYTLVRKGNNSIEYYIKLNDIEMSEYLSRIDSLMLAYFNKCDSFSDLACTLVSRMKPSKSVYVISICGRLHDKGGYEMSHIFYQELAQNDFNIVNAFDRTVRRVCTEDAGNNLVRDLWFPCLMRKSRGQEPELLRANWKLNENDIDHGLKETFQILCSKNVDLEVSGAEEYTLEGGYRGWEKGNEIGKKERAALRTMGFETSEGAYKLNKFGEVIDIDSFWGIQRNFDQSIWPVSSGARTWVELWSIALPAILKKCNDTDKLLKFEQDLRESIRLREIVPVGKKKMTTEGRRNHIGMLYQMRQVLVLASRRLYFRYSDEVLKTAGMRNENCAKLDVWSNKLPPKIGDFIDKSKLEKCQRHLEKALYWRKREYEEKKNLPCDENDSRMKELHGIISVIESGVLPSIREHLLTLS